MHKCPSETELSKAEKLLSIFSKWYIKYYGDENLTYTFHCISKHLIEDVKRHGSLCGHSMFSVESCLGYYRKSLNGTRGLDSQFMKSLKKNCIL